MSNDLIRDLLRATDAWLDEVPCLNRLSDIKTYDGLSLDNWDTCSGCDGWQGDGLEGGIHQPDWIQGCKRGTIPNERKAQVSALLTRECDGLDDPRFKESEDNVIAWFWPSLPESASYVSARRWACITKWDKLPEWITVEYCPCQGTGRVPFDLDGELERWPEGAREAVRLAYYRSLAAAAGWTLTVYNGYASVLPADYGERNPHHIADSYNADSEAAAAEAALRAAFGSEVQAS